MQVNIILVNDSLRRHLIDRIYQTEMTEENIADLIDFYIDCKTIVLKAEQEKRELDIQITPDYRRRKKELYSMIDQAEIIGDTILDVFQDQLSDEQYEGICSIINERVEQLDVTKEPSHEKTIGTQKTTNN